MFFCPKESIGLPPPVPLIGLSTVTAQLQYKILLLLLLLIIIIIIIIITYFVSFVTSRHAST